MDPRKRNANRAWNQREQERKEARRRSASEWQPEFFPQKEEKKMTKNIVIMILVVILLISSCCLASVVAGGGTTLAFWPRLIAKPAALAPTAAPTEPTNTEMPKSTPEVVPTEAPVVETEVPIVETEVPIVVVEPTVAAPTATAAPAAVVCTTPSIKASLDGQTWTEQGEFLDTVLGKRMTFTNRKVVVPSKAWNDPLTPDELKLVEQTWVSIQICVVEGQNSTLFAGGFEQGLNRFENGILLSLKPGLYEFNLRNGEAVIWYPGQETFSQKDLERIFDQIRNGNFDIKSPLDFFGVSTDLLPKVPQDLVKQRNVQIVPSVDPTLK